LQLSDDVLSQTMESATHLARFKIQQNTTLKLCAEYSQVALFLLVSFVYSTLSIILLLAKLCTTMHSTVMMHSFPETFP